MELGPGNDIISSLSDMQQTVDAKMASSQMSLFKVHSIERLNVFTLVEYV